MIRRSMNRQSVIVAVLAVAVLLLPFMSRLYADRQQGANHVGRLTVLTTLPVEAVAPLAAEYGRLSCRRRICSLHQRSIRSGK